VAQVWEGFLADVFFGFFSMLDNISRFKENVL
jgi:hypothetical protein